MTDPMTAREAFLDMMADANKWHTETDEGGTTHTIETGDLQLMNLTRALGIEVRWGEVTEDAIGRAIDAGLQTAHLDQERGEAGPVVLRPKTLEELDAILNSETDEPIEILPDGSIRHLAAPQVAAAPAQEEPVFWQWRQFHSGKWHDWNPCWSNEGRGDRSDYWRELAAKEPNGLQVRPLIPASALSTYSADVDEAYRYAANLLVSYAGKYCNPVPGFGPLPDLMGVLTQLDNASTVTGEFKARAEMLQADFNDCNSERARWKASAVAFESSLSLSRTELQRVYDNIAASFDKYSKQLGWGLTGYQPECWTLLDDTILELSLSRTRIKELEGALGEAINVLDGLNDDEINEDFLPRLRATLGERS